MDYIVMDLECTCWQDHTDPKRQEIIEIGAVRLDAFLEDGGTFARFVRPIENPHLSPFCEALTHISQDDIDRAVTFDEVFPQFLEWIGRGSYRVATWGAYDIRHIQIDCRRHGLKFPKRFSKKHMNVKADFAEWKGTRPCGMEQALQMMNIPLNGAHHRALDDAKNVVEIFRRVYA